MSLDGKYGQLWTAEEVTLALYLYCQVPFKKTKANNPMVRELAEHLGRTPASVARKLGNFGSFDPVLADHQIVGLGHASKTDRELWNKYAGNWAALVDDAVALWEGITLLGGSAVSSPEATSVWKLPPLPSGPSETRQLRSVRLHQSFFRRAVLTSYDETCCACGIEVPSLLTASHIVPWAKDEALRTDPTNGLCLCALHDRAFDRGLLAVSEEGRLLISGTLSQFKSSASRQYLLSLSGSPIRNPNRFAPNPRHLAWHRENVFLTPA